MSERRSTEKNRLMLSPYRVPLNTEKPQLPDLNVSYCNNCNNRLTSNYSNSQETGEFLIGAKVTYGTEGYMFESCWVYLKKPLFSLVGTHSKRYRDLFPSDRQYQESLILEVRYVSNEGPFTLFAVSHFWSIRCHN
jgi:hypothetical protein